MGPESRVELEIMIAVCEDYATLNSGGDYGCYVGLVHQSECNYVSYDNKTRLPANSPWWYNGEGIIGHPCEKYNRAGIYFDDPKSIAELRGAVGYGYELELICKLKRAQLKR